MCLSITNSYKEILHVYMVEAYFLLHKNGINVVYICLDFRENFPSWNTQIHVCLDDVVGFTTNEDTCWCYTRKSSCLLESSLFIIVSWYLTWLYVESITEWRFVTGVDYYIVVVWIIFYLIVIDFKILYNIFF
jgi:hypothetical protein